MNNTNLNTAKKAKNDEFYTQLVDIEKECINYKEYFKDKVIYCNCDDYQQSNFVKYFVENFSELGLKKLIATCYIKDGQGKYFEYNKQTAYNKKLEGNGDFRSPECIELLKESDIVVTNPPFSLFREYVAQLVEYGKQFLILGNMNAITYKEIFPLIKENKLWFGPSISSGDRKFYVPESYSLEAVGCGIDENGKRYIKVKGVRWFTNMEHDRRKPTLDLYMKYSNEYFPKYDNYDAIEVSKTCDIPMDYDGVMGVPITFLDKYCPEQFEIIGLFANKRCDIDCFIKGIPTYVDEKHKNYVGCVVKGKATYARILIRKK